MAKKLKPRKAAESRKKSSPRSRTLAESRGLGSGDAIFSERPIGLTLIDQQFDLWLTLWKMSPMALIGREQVAILRQMMEAQPSSPPRKRRRST